MPYFIPASMMVVICQQEFELDESIVDHRVSGKQGARGIRELGGNCEQQGQRGGSNMRRMNGGKWQENMKSRNGRMGQED